MMFSVKTIVKIYNSIMIFCTLKTKTMTEDFLHYVWKYHLYDISNLRTTTNEELVVLNAGLHNQNSGPDFLNAQLMINNQLWAGNVEIHLKSSDWYVHNHEVDRNYDAVILHVVWEDDATVFMKNNVSLPTLILKDFVLVSAIKNYKHLFSNQQKWIPCENEIETIDLFTLDNWKERLFFERLERKSNEISALLIKNNNDFEATFFQLLAKNFGLKVNGDAFFALAKAIDFNVVKKVRFDKNHLESLLFGQAGFLEGNVEEKYHQDLKKEYQYLQHKYKLKPIAKNQFSFFRMRPNNFPTIRIAQLAALNHQYQNMFSKLLDIDKLNDFYAFFNVDIHPFWKTHYTFDKESKSSSKKITKSFIDLLLINTIIPLNFLYQKSRGEVTESDFLNLIQQISAEKNNIIKKFKSLEISSKTAYDSQALLELKNNYCAKKGCLQCAIGVKLLKK